jgi:peroxiredoxin
MPPKSKIDLYAAIRRDARAGLSNRALQRKHQVGYRTVCKALTSVWPQPRKKPPSRTSRASRSDHERKTMSNLEQLPTDLPIPTDDGAADHLVGLAVPPIELPSTAGNTIKLASLGPGRSILYCYPLTGRPDTDLPAGWDAIPGARGCTPQACDFRDHHDDLAAAGASGVFGLSSQDTGYQQEVIDRLRLPFAMLSDTGFRLADALTLPTFEAGGMRLYKRLTLVIHDAMIEHVFYPIFPPSQHAQQVLNWLQANPL